MYRLTHRKPKGVTSLLLVIAISIALATMVAGITALSIREIRQASNTDLSNRAFQTAESAVRVVENQLQQNPDFKVTDCNDPRRQSLFGTVFTEGEQVTCLKVENQFANYEASLKKDDAVQVTIDDPTSSLANLELSWAKGGTLTQYGYTGPFYPPQDGYANAAGVELTLAYWPKTATNGYNSSSIQSRTVFVMPGAAGGTTNTGPPGFPPNATSYSSSCNSSVSASDYACKVNLTALLPASPTTYYYAIRIKPRYADTSFKLVARDGSSPAKDILVKSNKAQIDVTAKVGDLYRRVKANVVIRPSVVPNMFDSVLYSSVDTSEDNVVKDICKDIKVKRSTNANERVLVKNNSEFCK